MNPAKSKYKSGTPPKEQTIAIKEVGADLSLMITATAADGKNVSLSYTVPIAGGMGKILESSSYDGVSNKRIADNERQVSYMKGGKAVYTAHSKVSADGNTLSVASKGLSATGQHVDADVVYDKQQ